MNTDLTVGKPGKVLLKFCIPLFASIIFQQFYNLTDTIVCGKFINNDALAAVGNSYEITMLFITFANGCNMGCSVITAKLFGAKNYGKLKTSVYTALISTGVLCLLLVTFGLIFCGDLLTFINTPESIFADSKSYLDIYLMGLPFVFFYNISNGVFTALGDSKTPFYFLAASSVANIGMDILFVTVFNMGVPGVAWATFICQGISCALAFTFMIRRIWKIKYEGKVQLYSFDALKKIAAVAIPSMFQSGSVSIGNIIVQSVVNGFGTGVMAGFTTAFKMNSMALALTGAFSNGVSNFSGQNYGAGRIDRIKEGVKEGIKMGYCIAIPIALVYFFFGKNLSYLFLDSPTGEAVEMATKFLQIVSPFYLLVILKFFFDGTLRGCGLMLPFTIDTFIDLVIRVALSVVLSKTSLGSVGVPLSWPIGWIIGVVLAYIFYRHYMKKLKQKAAQ